LPGAEKKEYPRWPLWLALSLILVVEFFFIVKLIAEGDTSNIPTIVNSVGLIVFCVLTWRRIPWSRWLLIAFLVWRIGNIGIHMASHLAPGDHRLAGSLSLVAFYVIAGLLIASPLGRLDKHSAT
jgi:hypothetical protein